MESNTQKLGSGSHMCSELLGCCSSQALSVGRARTWACVYNALESNLILWDSFHFSPFPYLQQREPWLSLYLKDYLIWSLTPIVNFPLLLPTLPLTDTLFILLGLWCPSLGHPACGHLVTMHGLWVSMQAAFLRGASRCPVWTDPSWQTLPLMNAFFMPPPLDPNTSFGLSPHAYPAFLLPMWTPSCSAWTPTPHAGPPLLRGCPPYPVWAQTPSTWPSPGTDESIPHLVLAPTPHARSPLPPWMLTFLYFT